MSQETPELDQHDAKRRELVEHALGDQADELGLKPRRLADIILHIVRGPADGGGRMVLRAAGVHPDRQSVPLGRRVDRPVQPPAERRVAAHQHQHLHEAPIGGAALDLLDRELGVAGVDKDRGSQARVAVEPFARHPFVHRAGKSGAHVLAEHRERAVQAVADRVARAECVERLGLHGFQLRGGVPLLRPPIGAGVAGIVRRIGGEVEAVDAPADHLLAPVLVEIGQQIGHPGRRRMDVAVDRPQVTQCHDATKAHRARRSNSRDEGVPYRVMAGLGVASHSSAYRSRRPSGRFRTAISRKRWERRGVHSLASWPMMPDAAAPMTAPTPELSVDCRMLRCWATTIAQRISRSVTSTYHSRIATSSSRRGNWIALRKVNA